MFSSQPKILLCLSRASLKVYSKKRDAAQLVLPIEAVQHLEVYDTRKLDEVLMQFISEQKIRNQPLCLLLDQSVLFEKTIPAGKDSEAQFADFESKLPFDTDARQIVAAPTENHAAYRIFGTNKKFYKAVLAPFERADCKVMAVMPATAFGLGQNAAMSPDAVASLLRSVHRYKRVQFATV